MLEELGKIDHVGRKNDILFFLQKVIGRQLLLENDIRAISKHLQGAYQLNVDFLLPYCLQIGLLKSIEGKILLFEDLVKYIDDSQNTNLQIIKKSIDSFFNEQIFQPDMFMFDIFYNQFVFKNERLPLSFAVFRNILVNHSFFEIFRMNGVTKFVVNKNYESILSKHCKIKKRTIGIEQLRRELEANSIAGEKAESFVLDYEKKRITSQLLADKIRIISDIDVCAGYDIISFDNETSDNYDRFIEVKAISNTRAFYWSINELNTAKVKGVQYFLYLVDLQKVLEDNYTPIIICNPSDTIFNSGEWYVEPQSFQVRHIFQTDNG